MPDRQPHERLLDVTDLKQYSYCRRIPFYRYCLPRIRPITYSMREGIRSHEEESAREERRSLRTYGLTAGERVFDLLLRSESLGLVARLDLAIRCGDPSTGQSEAVVVDYKLTSEPARDHFRLQLAAYAMMIEEAWQIPVRRGFLYHIPLRRAEEIAITAALRRRVLQSVQDIHALVRDERMPAPPANRARCVTCEFRRFCNDAI
ncbi:MAG: CRISPR-associated protein Cas4 [Ktedonobacterales bacterium]